jgi:hypothetical protein
MRQSQGYFSWLATLVPAETSANPQYWRLSIVEFHKRPFDTTAGAAWRTFTPDSWTGDSATIATPIPKDQFSDFFRSGSVVLASDNATNNRWLRILRASPTESSDVTTVTSIDLTFDQDVTTQFIPNRIDAYAGNVGVAEQIVRLEGESPWVTP